MAGSWKASKFPKLVPPAFAITSFKDTKYNCIAWAAGDITQWWWPQEEPRNPGVYWPAGVSAEETVQAFVEAFATVGFLPCGQDGTLESGFEKVALYVDEDELPSHAAKQLSSGLWSSKLGSHEDIIHLSVEEVSEPYGIVAVYLRRERRPIFI